MLRELLSKPKTLIDRLGFTFLALAIAFAGLLPTLILDSPAVHANGSGGQVQARSITMSSSTPSATGVTYAVTFTPVTNETHPDVLVDFCSNDPLVGDSCTATSGTDTPSFASAAATGWTLTTIGSGRGVKLVTSTVSFTGGTPVTITITNVTNPSVSGTLGSFYGRILDYANGGAGTNTSASPGSYVDWGGIALSTTVNISITAKVFETLSFCVYNSSCGTAASLALGATSTGALNTGTSYVNSGASYTLATNAAHSVTVTMTGQTLCSAVVVNFTNCPTGGSTSTISAMGATAIISAVGTSQFGMCAYNGGNGSLTIASTYNDTTGTHCNGITTGTYAGSSLFGFNDTGSSGGTNNTAGSTVMSTTGPLASTTGNFTFLGNIASTTPAGIYTSNLNMVATGSF